MEVSVVNTRRDASTIARADVDAWIRLLLERTEVVAPVTGLGGEVAFSTVTAPAQVTWHFENPLLPPKAFVLPQTDPIVAIRRVDGRHEVESVPETGPRILFNIRSCDVVAMRYLRHFHTHDLVDETVVRRLDRTTLVSLACTDPPARCFCPCTDAGPFLREGYDLQLTDLGEVLVAEPGSERGHALLAEAEALFRPAERGEIAERERLEEHAMRSFGPHTSHFGAAMRRISTGRVPRKLWGDAADWCLECGGCTHICPTCTCFSVKDQPQGDGMWLRCRTWDSCQYTAFTLEASGHNPRQDRGDRMKRRFFHKASAQYARRDGRVGCVGCGRCIDVCMGTTHMPAVITAIRKGVWNG